MSQQSSRERGAVHLRGNDNERSVCGAEMVGLGDFREVICIARNEWNIIRAAITPAEFAKTYCQKCAAAQTAEPVAVKCHLTVPQAKALLQAATAMLAGEEGEGDACLSFGVLERAANVLRAIIRNAP